MGNFIQGIKLRRCDNLINDAPLPIGIPPFNVKSGPFTQEYSDQVEKCEELLRNDKIDVGGPNPQYYYYNAQGRLVQQSTDTDLKHKLLSEQEQQANWAYEDEPEPLISRWWPVIKAIIIVSIIVAIILIALYFTNHITMSNFENNIFALTATGIGFKGSRSDGHGEARGNARIEDTVATYGYHALREDYSNKLLSSLKEDMRSNHRYPGSGIPMW